MINSRLLVLSPDFGQIIGSTIFSQQFLRAIRQIVSSSSLIALSLDEAVTWHRWMNLYRTFRYDSKWSRLDRKIRYGLKVIQESLINRPQVALCLVESLTPPCLFLRYLLGMEYAVLSHDGEWEQKSVLTKEGLKNASWVIANSRSTRGKVLEQLSLNPERVMILPPPVDENRFYPTGKRWDLINKYGLEGHKVLLTVGRLDPPEMATKGYGTVIEALPLVLQQIPKVKYLIVGPGDGRSHLHALSIMFGVQDHVVLVGSVPDEEMCNYYNLCDLFVLPSKQEGFGIVYLEALACGKPVIGGAAKGAYDALLDGKLGLLVNPDDVSKVVEGIINMLEGRVESRLLDPEYLRKTVLEHYGFEQFTERVRQLLEVILKK